MGEVEFDFSGVPEHIINQQDEDGNTLLLLLLMYEAPLQFIESILSAKANIIIANKKGISPLSFTITHCSHLTQLLLQKTTDSQFIYETTWNTTLRNVIKSAKCGLKLYVINKNLETEKVLICVTTLNPLYEDNVAVTVRELKVFLDQLETYGDMRDDEFGKICVTLIKESICLNCDKTFKLLWTRNRVVDACCTESSLLCDFVTNCGFGNSEFVEGLLSLLASPKPWHFPYHYRVVSYGIYFQSLIWKLFSRNIDKQSRMLIITRSVGLMEVTFQSIKNAYKHFGFNEEVVVLLHNFNPRESDYIQILGFLNILETNPKLSIGNISKFNLMSKMAYGKLINSVPEKLLADNESIRLKKKILNKVPTLFEIGMFGYQKFLKKIYNIQDFSQFDNVVESLTLPSVIKDKLSQEPPMYYDL